MGHEEVPKVDSYRALPTSHQCIVWRVQKKKLRKDMEELTAAKNKKTEELNAAFKKKMSRLQVLRSLY